MEKGKMSNWCDDQSTPPLAICPRCKKRVRLLDPVGDVGEDYLHIDCMTPDEQEFCRIAPAAAFFQEGTV